MTAMMTMAISTLPIVSLCTIALTLAHPPDIKKPPDVFIVPSEVVAGLFVSVPYEEQQGAWASWSKGVLKIPPEEMADLAGRIGRRIGLIYPA
jgi:hypothetical protein